MAVPSNYALDPHKSLFYPFTVLMPAMASGAIASGSTSTTYIFHAPYACKLYGIDWVPSATVSGTADNYTSFSAIHFLSASGSTGGTTLGTVNMSGTATIYSGGYGVSLYNPTTPLSLAEGDKIGIRYTNTGLGFTAGMGAIQFSYVIGS